MREGSDCKSQNVGDQVGLLPEWDGEAGKYCYEIRTVYRRSVSVRIWGYTPGAMSKTGISHPGRDRHHPVYHAKKNTFV